MLSVIPTPIGNLEDITLRALRLLKEADAIYCEDTRTTAKLCSHYDIHTPRYAYHKHNEQKSAETILEKLRQGAHIALVSDAGMPSISDPGAHIIALARKENLEVEVLPGPSAAITALVASGLSCEHFRFVGFLERKGKERTNMLLSLDEEEATTIIYESPKRTKKTIAELAERFPQRRCALCRELTKRFEEVRLLPLEELLESLEEEIRGEVVLVLEGAALEKKTSLDEAIALLEEALAQGEKKSLAAGRIAKITGHSRKTLYEAMLQKEKEATL